MSTNNLSLSIDDTALLVVDVQQRLAAAMEPEAMARVERAIVTLIRGATALGVPVLCTEQYPKGLGPTTSSVREALPDAGAIRDKTQFSCRGAVLDPLGSAGVRKIVICGMETHVCVFQTVRDLAERGYVLHVVSDGVISRSPDNRSVGLGLMDRSGAVITSVETVLFDLMGGSHHPAFREISKLVR